MAQHFDPSTYNISLGQPLCQFPLVSHALSWLNVDDSYLTPHEVGLLLQSPYISGSKEEFLARSDYLQEGYLLENHWIPFKTLREDLHVHLPKLANLLSQLNPYPQEASIQEWILLFQHRLAILGFPGDYTLSSENYQCLNRFIAIFDELRQFALLGARFTKLEALEAVKFLTENTIFQAQKTNAPIQISGLLEASGCEFDNLWFMGLTDHCLPQKVHLSAFIPPQLQRELGMPHSVPERELQFAQLMLHRLQRSAKQVVFSYPLLQADTPNLPCSLIMDFPDFQPYQFPHEVKNHLHYPWMRKFLKFLFYPMSRYLVAQQFFRIKPNALLKHLQNIDFELKLRYPPKMVLIIKNGDGYFTRLWSCYGKD